VPGGRKDWQPSHALGADRARRAPRGRGWGAKWVWGAWWHRGRMESRRGRRLPTLDQTGFREFCALARALARAKCGRIATAMLCGRRPDCQLSVTIREPDGGINVQAWPRAFYDRPSPSYSYDTAARLRGAWALLMVFRTPADIAADAEVRGLRRALIVTALKPEMQAVRAHLTHLVSSSGRIGTVYECGRFTAEGEDWLIVVAECGPGNYAAHSVVTNALIDFPGCELVLFSGIAGSRKSDAPIGSVIAASHVYNPYSGKYAKGEFSSRPRELRIDHRLVQLARKVSRDEDWHSRIRPMLNGPVLPPSNDCPQPFPPGSFVAPIVAVEAVVADPESDLACIIDEHGSDAHAVEMEGYGAVFAADMEGIPILVVRGISDMLAGKTAQRDAVDQPLAAIFAAAFTFELLNLWSHSQSRPPAAPTPGRPLVKAGSPSAPPCPPAVGIAVRKSDPLADVTVVFNFDGDASEFPPERAEAIAATVARELGIPTRIVKSETGSYRLFIAFEGKIEALPTDALRRKLDEEHGVELLGAVDVREYEHIRAFEAEIERCSRGLLSWPTKLPDGRHLIRPEVDQLWNIVRERVHSTTVVLGAPGSGKSALLATFSAMAARDDWPMLGLKADLLPPYIESEDDLQHYLDLSMRPTALLKRIASFRPVMLVIDQLDALAGYLDLRTARLNVLLNLVRRLGRTRNLHIVLSARTFEFEHDVRLRTVSAESTNLKLPPWAEILTVLDAHGVKAEGWPRDAQEVMRSPQALATFLRLKDHAGDEPFTTYQAMLDQLWTERILSLPSGARVAHLASDIAQTMATEENLWLAKARFEDQMEDLNTLLRLDILTTTDAGTSIGFTHQTLFDHALARSFARQRGRLSKYVLERQDSLFIRPKLWAALTYLRAVESATYEQELRTIWCDASLRPHLRMLLVDFLGQQTQPTDGEALLMASVLERPAHRQQGFRAISGSPGWFHRFKKSFLADAMRLDTPSATLAAGVLHAALPFARDEVVALIREHWTKDMTYDTLSWNILTTSTNWSDEVLELATRIVSRSEISSQAIDYVISNLGIESPEAATKLVRAKLDRDLADALRESAERQAILPPQEERAYIEWSLANSPKTPLVRLGEDGTWDALGALAEHAPAITLKHLWPWFFELIGSLRRLEHPRDDLSYAMPYDFDYRFEGEHSLGLPEPAILGALRIAVEGLAASDRQAFTDWVADNAELDAAPVHRLFAHAMSTQPERYATLALDYLLADPRRFYLGGIEDRCGTSKRLVRAVAPYWPDSDIERFVDAVHAYAPKPPPKVTEARNRRWFSHQVRRIRVGHLQALPAERVSTKIKRFIKEELRALGDDRIGATFSGFEHIGSPMSRHAFERAGDDDVIKAFQELPDATGWEHPRRSMTGGNIPLSREFAEFAKSNPERAARLISQFEPSFGEQAAGYALDAMAEEADPKLIIGLFIELVGRGFDDEEFRNSVAHALERLVRRNYPVGDEVLGQLEHWLERKPSSEVGENANSEQVGDVAEEEPVTEKVDERDSETRSVLWGYTGFSLVPGGNYPVLETIVRILIARPDHNRLGAILIAHLRRPEDPKVWQALLRFLIYFRPSDESVRPTVISEIFRRYPTLLQTREAAQILAHGQWWAPDMVREVLQAWPSDTARMRQTHGELVALVAMVQPKLGWASEALCAVVEKSECKDARLGAAFSAVNLWKEPNHRHSATELLVRLIPHADQHIWHAVFDLFRIIDELTPDPDTIHLLTVIADNMETAVPVGASFVVQRLQTLLPHEAQLVARLIQGLIAHWREELGDIRTGTAVASSELVDLAITLHRLGPETRDVGMRILEDLLSIDAWTVRRTMDEIDNRFRSERGPARARLPRRSARARRRASHPI
jgi:nucleoside phosphorylase